MNLDKKNVFIMSLLFVFAIHIFVSESMLNAETTPPETSPAAESSEDVKNATEETPTIFFENPDFDFKKIYKGEKVDHVYTFENRGKGVLKIGKVKSSCGCTAVMLTKKTIQPGETGEIKATFNSSSYKGKVTKSITVISNDPDSLKYRLTLAAEIIEVISVKPEYVSFGSIHEQKKVEQTVTVKSQTGTKFKLIKIEPTKPIVTVSIEEENDEGYVLKVSLMDGMKIGRFNGAINLETDNPKQPKVKIPFSGEIVGDLAPYPRRLYYGFITNGKAKSLKLFIKINKEGIKITEIKTSPDFVSATIVEESHKEKPHYLIDVKVNKEARIGDLKGEVVLHTNSEKFPVIKVPVIGEVKDDKLLPTDKPKKLTGKTLKEAAPPLRTLEQAFREAAAKAKKEKEAKEGK